MRTHWFKKYLHDHPEYKAGGVNPLALTYCGEQVVKAAPLNPRFDRVDCQKCLDVYASEKAELDAIQMGSMASWAARGHI